MTHFRSLTARPVLRGSWVLLVIASVALSPPVLATAIGLGTADSFAVLALNGSHVFMGTAATINGAFGIGPYSHGALEGGTINGTLYPDLTSAANVAVDPAVTITGGTATVDLSQPNSDALAASASFAALPVTRPDVTSITDDLTINSFGGDSVFQLTSVNMTGKTLTLNGAVGDYVIFNVTGDLHFQASSIVL